MTEKLYDDLRRVLSSYTDDRLAQYLGYGARNDLILTRDQLLDQAAARMEEAYYKKKAKIALQCAQDIGLIEIVTSDDDRRREQILNLYYKK